MWGTFDDIDKQKKGTRVVVAPVQKLITNDPDNFLQSVRTGTITKVVDNAEICIDLNKVNANDYTDVSYHPTKRFVYELDNRICFTEVEVSWNETLPFRKQVSIAFVLLSNFKVGIVSAVYENMFAVTFSINNESTFITKVFFNSGICANTPMLRVLRNITSKEASDIKNGKKIRAKFLNCSAPTWYNYMVDDSWFSNAAYKHIGKECIIGNCIIAADVPYVVWVQFVGVKGQFKVPAYMLEYIVDKDSETCNTETVVENTITKSKEDKKMKNFSSALETESPKTTVLEDVKNKAKEDAIFIAKMTAGKTALKKITKWYVAKSPIMVRGYAETYSPFLNLFMSMGLAVSLKRFFPDDPRTEFACDALELAALSGVSEVGADFLVEILDMFPVPELMKSETAKKSTNKKISLNETE